MNGFTKRILSAYLAVSCCCMTAFGAGYEGFVKKNTYTSGRFTDVAASVWYEDNVKTAYELGLVQGTSDTKFSPDSNLTIAEAVKLAAVLHATYQGTGATFGTSAPWYQTYVDYAKQNGIITAGYTDYTVAVTRAQFAQILEKALPSDALPAINDVEDGAIPDVQQSTAYGGAAYTLYRAGVLTGSGKTGAFNPTAAIKRSEATAIVTRMADPALRMSVTLIKASALSSEAIYEQCAPAVFYVEIFDANGKAISMGSGVFISANGEALTNYHVIEGAHSAKITTADGTMYDVEGCYDYDQKLDLAYIKIKGSGFPYLPMNTSVTTGEKVYTIGNPLGLQNAFSEGLVSSAVQTFEGVNYIQMTAPISHGSSGGALINTQGELIGITTAYFDGGQNLNLAMPLDSVSAMKKDTLQSLSSIAQATTDSASSTVKTYDGFAPAPDFGAYVGAPVAKTETKDGYVAYFYQASQFQMKVDDAIAGYDALLQKNGFEYYTTASTDNFAMLYYTNTGSKILLGFGGGGSETDGYIIVTLAKV